MEICLFSVKPGEALFCPDEISSRAIGLSGMCMCIHSYFNGSMDPGDAENPDSTSNCCVVVGGMIRWIIPMR